MPTRLRNERRTAIVRLGVALAVALLVCAASAAPSYARRHVPFGLFGTVLDGPTLQAPDAQLNSQMGLMARSGVESVRAPMYWGGIEPLPGVYDFSSADRIVRLAAMHGMSVLPTVMNTPAWASERPFDEYNFLYAPRQASMYGDFMRTLVARYGPRGTFWRQNPRVPRIPIRAWQIWNEPAADFFWKSRPYAKTYTRLLRAAYVAVHHADHGAQVVLAGLAGLNNATPWGELKAMYRYGARGHFDVVAVHPFSNDQRGARQSVNRALAIVSRVRSEMRRHGDRRKPVWLTELSWTAALHRLPHSLLLGLDTTARGQSQRLAEMYSRIARDHRLGIRRAYWYTWSSYYAPHSVGGLATAFQYTGLTRSANGGRFGVMPLLSTYRRTAIRYEGCRKTSDARRCRR